MHHESVSVEQKDKSGFIEVSREAISSDTEDVLDLLRKAVDPDVIMTLDSERFKDVQRHIVQVQHTLQDYDASIEGFCKEREELEGKLANLGDRKVVLQQQRIQRKRSILHKLKMRFFRDKQYERLLQTISRLGEEQLMLNTGIERIGYELDQLQEAKKKLPAAEVLEEKFKREMAKTPLSHDEKLNFLQPEVLSELSTEQYIALWRRLHPYFVSHTIRQGVRDHIGMLYHDAGRGDFHTGFTDILTDQGLIRPPFGLRGLRSRTDASVENWLGNILLEESEKAALNRLTNLLHTTFASAPLYPDKTAVHFGVQEVLNGMYGGETSNEIFCIFPADVIASQFSYGFNTGIKDFSKPCGEAKWNDLFVWPQSLDNAGITIHAGIVFLPKSAAVDPGTGSRYIFSKEAMGSVVEAKDVMHTISSEKYWREYFEKNPAIAPRHAIFYEGEPTEAVHDFLVTNDIGGSPPRIDEDPLLGFKDNCVTDMVNDPRANQGYVELKATAERIIKARFNET